MAYQNPLKDGQDIRNRTFAFACRIVTLCRQLYEAGGICWPLASQLVRCGTSVAAMLEEAKAAESRRDFISKCSIGLKEAREAHVRLRIQSETKIGPPQETRALMTEAHEISCILAAIVRNTKMRQAAQAATSLVIALLAAGYMLWKR